MQRKNRTLKNGFAMIMAIAVIVIISTIMALSLALTSTTTKRTIDSYLYEQAMLLSHSATEYALLKISQANPCSLAGLNFTQNSIYDVNISMKYIYTSDVTCTNGAKKEFNITTPEENGSVMLDISVSTNSNAKVSEPIRFFKRTIQKL